MGLIGLMSVPLQDAVGSNLLYDLSITEKFRKFAV